DAFLNKKIKYTDIPNGIEKIMNMYEKRELKTVEEILVFDKEVREKTREMIGTS
ncbi:MAG: 1-deoxy-D-xylulose-5-phosphate reductoisomerase, partial [Clostridia bacterium]|nr:1-deoxy-D-xylulose-5-phosphate reductoisomerase [Clostridia bacterium]